MDSAMSARDWRATELSGERLITETRNSAPGSTGRIESERRTISSRVEGWSQWRRHSRNARPPRGLYSRDSERVSSREDVCLGTRWNGFWGSKTCRRLPSLTFESGRTPLNHPIEPSDKRLSQTTSPSIRRTQSSKSERWPQNITHQTWSTS